LKKQRLETRRFHFIGWFQMRFKLHKPGFSLHRLKG
jgi:hypothetical protein